MEHTLKILPEHYAATASGKKLFTIRKNDRDFKLGDTLIKQEWNGTEYTGKKILCYVTYVFLGGEYGLEKGYCILGLRITDVINPHKNK